MKPIKWPKNNYRKVEVHWRDSSSYARPWHDPKELREDMPQSDKDFIITRGFAFMSSRHWLYVALSLSISADKVQRFGDVLRIPFGSIIKILYPKGEK
jgi:hypothetical protein